MSEMTKEDLIRSRPARSASPFRRLDDFEIPDPLQTQSATYHCSLARSRMFQDTPAPARSKKPLMGRSAAGG